jgi:CRISPR-associated endonuclease/helicase Cas3
MLDLPSFPAWFGALNGMKPFPWQNALATQVCDRGWPGVVAIPTGLGKTACIDIAVWAMAAEADDQPAARRHPRRVWWVVNRRLLVDVAADRASSIAERLQEAAAGDNADPAIRAVAERLRSLGGVGTGPLHVAGLRGGLGLGDRPPDPCQPSVILATPAMYGSRLLFRGFGTSAGMRPVDAALAGTDSLVLIDESHLAEPLRALASQLAGCDGHASRHILPHGRGAASVVQLSATANPAPGEERFGLTPADLEDEVVRERLDASKPVTLAPTVKKRGLVASLANAVTGWIEGGGTGGALVFCNSPATARSVFASLDVDDGPMRLELLTGRIREHDAGRIRARLIDPSSGLPASAHPVTPDKPLVVVATQTLEVGADLDADFLVTQSCGVRSLTQRLGRLNRLGKRPHARGVIIHAEDDEGGIYGAEVAELWERLKAAADDGVIDLGTGGIADALGAPAEADLSLPTVLPGHLWEWAKTSAPPPGEAPVEVFILGRPDDLVTVDICWRAEVSAFVTGDDLSREGDATGPRFMPSVTSDERITIPIGEARTALKDLPDLHRLSPDRASLQSVTAERLRPGDIVVLPSTAGFADEHGWNPSARRLVTDASLELGQFVVLTRPVLEQLFDDAVTEDGTRVVDALERVTAWTLAGPDERPPDPPHIDQLTKFASTSPGRPADVCWSVTEAAGVARSGAATVGWLRTPIDAPPFVEFARPAKGQRSAPARIEAVEELSFGGPRPGGSRGTSPGLAPHLLEVGAMAANLARGMGMEPPLVAACQLAGELHDLGKLDDRFQRWLHDGAGVEPLAKSAHSFSEIRRRRRASGWPAGGRHELLSLRLAQEARSSLPDDVDAELVLHLVAAHHGFGRPSFPPCDDGIEGSVVTTVLDVNVEVDANLAGGDLAQPRRFRTLTERYGAWGLALLEATVRQADHAVSAVVVA